MWPFRKTTRNTNRLPIDGPWLVGNGDNEGSIMIVRTNTGYREFGALPGYEHQVGIAVPLRAPEATGLPSPEENAELGVIEDAIRDSLQERAESLLVAVITTGGMREFVFYTRAPKQLEERLKQLREHITSHEIQVMIQPDKNWEIYRQFS
jgi:hypothetical protein